jgi:hypothetical protein
MTNFIHAIRGLSKGGVDQLGATVGIVTVWGMK